MIKKNNLKSYALLVQFVGRFCLFLRYFYSIFQLFRRWGMFFLIFLFYLPHHYSHITPTTLSNNTGWISPLCAISRFGIETVPTFWVFFPLFSISSFTDCIKYYFLESIKTLIFVLLKQTRCKD